MLQQRRIDFAIDIEPDADRRLAFQPLLSDEFVLVVRRGDPLDRREPLPWSELKGQRFIDMAAASSVRRTTEIAFARADVAHRPLYECAYISTVGGLISAGLGVSRPLINPTISRTIGIVTLRSRSLSPSAEALFARLRDARWSDRPHAAHPGTTPQA